MSCAASENVNSILTWDIFDPCPLVSLWEIMERFHAEKFYSLCSVLEKLKVGLSVPSSGDPAFNLNRDPQLSEQKRQAISDQLSNAASDSWQAGLQHTSEVITEFRQHLLAWKVPQFATFKTSQAIARVDEIDRSIRREMRQCLFMRIPADRAEFYESYGIARKAQGPLFGESVSSAFPSSAFDVTEAGNCFASGRYTASVFHLMRVLEIGLRVLAEKFGIAADHKNWQNVIGEIEAKIKQMASDPNRPSDWKDQQEFYSQAASHLLILKDAWRNYTAHVRGKYTGEEAHLLVLNTREFMQRLAKRLSE